MRDGRALYFAQVLYFLFFERHILGGVTKRNLTKICHMFGSERDLKISVKNWGFPP